MMVAPAGLCAVAVVVTDVVAGGVERNHAAVESVALGPWLGADDVRRMVLGPQAAGETR